ncbi:MAG: RDD family protein [Desulfuromonadales bacterium]|nr:RDD family protein [Desulfuromonadales bacterium]
MTELSCPYCGFSKQVDLISLPPRTNRVTCPRCRQSFPLPRLQVSSEQRATDPQTMPKAGFWIRVTAAILDAILVGFLQGGLGGLLYLAGALNGSANQGLTLLVQIFTYLLSCVYYILFTGYCGQTPGKMALRIKVIRCDGSSLSYGRAAFREIPAKFIAGIILGIGYLMVAFDEQKQGLHDRMADTYVIKL